MFKVMGQLSRVVRVMMTSARSSETSATPMNSSPAQSPFNPDNQTSRSNVTFEFQPFAVLLLYIALDLQFP